MRDQLELQLRPRLLAILAAAVLTLVLSPYPQPRPWVAPLRQAQTSMGFTESEDPNLFSSALTLYPELAGLRFAAAESAVRAGETDLAIQLLAEAQGELPEHTGCLRLQAELLAATPIEAAAALNSAPDACPLPLARLMSLATAALEAGNLRPAVEMLEAVSASQPENPDVWLRLGQAQMLSADSQAVGSLTQALDLGMQDPLLFELLEAESAGEARGSTGYFKQIGQAFARHQSWPMAAIAFQAALDLDSDDWQATAYLGLAQDRSGQNGVALLERAFSAAPDHPLPAFFLGLHWLETGELQRALFFIRRASSLEPSNPAYAAQLGAALSASGDLQAARAAFENAIELAPDSPEFWYLAARFAEDHEIDVRSFGLPAARRAFLLSPTSSHADALGYAHYLLGSYHLAQRFLHLSLRLDPESARAHYHLGLCALDLDQPALATEHLGQAISLDPDGTTGQLAERALEGLRTRE